MGTPRFALLLLCAVPLALIARSGAAQDEATSSGPRNYTTPGGSQAEAAGMLAEMRLQQKERDLCQDYGCIVIVNETRSYRVTGFYVGEHGRRGDLRWSRNQFGDPLLPRRATFRYKSAKEDCARPVRFTLRRSGTGETMTVERIADFCPTPMVHSLIRIKVLTPDVIVE